LVILHGEPQFDVDDRGGRRTMKVAFRVDANETIGTGHLVRSLALANELVRFGARCRFITRSLSPHLEASLRQAGHQFDILPPATRTNASSGTLAHAEWLGATQEADARQTSSVLAEDAVDWLVVDHYGIDGQWIDLLRSKARHLAAIDDLADRALPVDILVDQNFHPNPQTRYNGLTPSSTLRLLGPRFALLRPEFRRVDKKIDAAPDEPKKLFICLGGAAPKSVVSDVLSALPVTSMTSSVTLVAPGFSESDLSRAHPPVDVRLMGHVENMAHLLRGHDIAIGSGGGMLWERLCLGIPSIVFGFAKNQEAGIKSLLDAGLVKGLKSLHGVSQSEVRDITQRALLDKDWQAAASSEGKMLVDGFGAVRVAAAMLASELCLRLANSTDGETVLPWRNDFRTRRFFSNPAPLQPEHHLAWWQRAVVDDTRLLLIGTIGAIPVGVVRFDIAETTAVISIYVDPDLAGSRIGTRLLQEGLGFISARKDPPHAVHAEIRSDNLASRALFKAAGFEPCGTDMFRLQLK
jgi:UDP-2,4-diacetamido-2,4,6-trideoxy-beta-L-altropyranose hydrolase